MPNLNLLKPVGTVISYLNYKADRLRLAKRISQGLKVGKNVYINENVTFDDNYPFLIEIGDNCRISIGVRILAHDASAFRDLGVTRVAPVRVLEGCFIGERVFILPGVTIGPRALIAAGSVVNRDIPEGKAAAGNPARPYGTFEDILTKYREDLQSGIVFNKKDVEEGIIDQKDIIRATNENSVAFIRGIPTSDPYYVNADMNKIWGDAMRAYEKVRSHLHPFD